MVTIAAENYPAFAGATGISGKTVVLYVNYGTGATEAVPVWTLVGGLENLKTTPTVDVQTTQTKDSGLWAEGAVSGKSMEISADILAKRDSVGQEAIKAFVFNDDITLAKNALHFARVDKDTKEYLEFKAIPTEFEETAEADGLVEYAFKATVVGKPEQKTGFAIE